MDIQRNRSSSAQSKKSLQDKMEPSNQLYVCFLPSDVQQQQLREIFGECGQVQKIILKKKQDGFTFCYVHYQSIEEAQRAVTKLNRRKIGDKSISVKFAAPFQKKTEGDKKGNGGEKKKYQGKNGDQGKPRFQGRQNKFNERSHQSNKFNDRGGNRKFKQGNNERKFQENQNSKDDDGY